MRALDPVALECFAVVIEEGTFERAAFRQQLSQSAVSQRVTRLEEQVGQRLVLRSRPVEATRVGQLVLKHAKKVRAISADLGSDLRELAVQPSRRLREENRISIVVDADSLSTWAISALTNFSSDGQLLEVVGDDNHQAHDWLVNGQVHACITPKKEGPQGYKATFLGSWDYVAVAQAGYAARNCPTGLGLDNFRRLPFIALDRKDDSQAAFVAKVLGLQSVQLNQIYLPSTQGRLGAVLFGLGVSILPKVLAQPHLKRGELVDIAPGHSISVSLYLHHWKIESKTLERLVTCLTTTASSWLDSGDRFRN